MTGPIAEGRRPSSSFMPIPRAKKGGRLVFDEWTGDRIEENRLINRTGLVPLPMPTVRRAPDDQWRQGDPHDVKEAVLAW